MFSIFLEGKPGIGVTCCLHLQFSNQICLVILLLIPLNFAIACLDACTIIPSNTERDWILMIVLKYIRLLLYETPSYFMGLANIMDD